MNEITLDINKITPQDKKYLVEIVSASNIHSDSGLKIVTKGETSAVIGMVCRTGLNSSKFANGDIILMSQYAGEDIYVKGKKYSIVDEEKIIAKVSK